MQSLELELENELQKLENSRLSSHPNNLEHQLLTLSVGKRNPGKGLICDLPKVVYLLLRPCPQEPRSAVQILLDPGSVGENFSF